jgi:glycolate oxidase
LLGIVVEATVRILPKPPVTRTLLAAFKSVPDAGQCVANIIAGGVVPAAMEFMDRRAVEAVEDYSASGYPRGAEGVLIVDADGLKSEVDDAIARIADIARGSGAEVREAADEDERARLWAGRKAAFPAMGRLAPDMLCMDGTIPRKRLPEVLARMSAMAEEYGLGFCNVFHAGDGNLHPLIIFDVMKEGELARAEKFGAEILKLCVEVGGVLTGEHGVGVEKRDLMGEMFTDADLAQQQRLKCAFDGAGLLNPGKVFPTLSACVEGGHMHVKGGKLPFANLPRF